MKRPVAARVVALLALLSAAGCSTLSSWIPPPPSLNWFSSSKKPGPLPAFTATVTPRVAWQHGIGKGGPGLEPAVQADAIYAASLNGALVRLDASTGATGWRVETGKPLSAAVGADASIVAVGTDKGEVIAYTADGKPAWQIKVTSEVVSPPKVADGVVVVWSGDGRVFGLSATDGKTRWVYQRNNPPLTVRNYSGGAITRGGLFMGTAGGKLVALDLATGNVGWEANVATPKGATELERIADVTSLPLLDASQACAVAYQGRIACFDIRTGTLNWSRDVSSLEGIAADSRYVYVTDDKGSIQALDKTTGASAWKQDKLALRRPGGPQMVGGYVAVVDAEGYVHLLDSNDGNLVGRVATDGTPATAQPSKVGDGAVWQSTGGAVFSVSAR